MYDRTPCVFTDVGSLILSYQTSCISFQRTLLLSQHPSPNICIIIHIIQQITPSVALKPCSSPRAERAKTGKSHQDRGAAFEAPCGHFTRRTTISRYHQRYRCLIWNQVMKRPCFSFLQPCEKRPLHHAFSISRLGSWGVLMCDRCVAVLQTQ